MAAPVSFYSDFVGDYTKDSIQLQVTGQDGSKDVRIYSGYEVKCSILQQPSAFSFRIGNGDNARELRRMLYKGDEFKLLIDGTPIMAGQIEAATIPEGEFVQLDIKGRDWMAPFAMSNILDEISFNEPTYFELVKRVMDIVGVGSRQLISSNDANRWHIARVDKARKRRTRKGTTASPKAANLIVEQLETGMIAPGGAKVVLQSIRAKVGESWHQWLDKQLKLAGLLLWASWDGTYILSAPNITTEPWYKITCKRGQTREQTNIITGGLKDDSTNEHTSVIINAHHGAGAGGRQKASAAFVNFECAQTFKGFRPLSIEDDDVKTPEQAMYRAKRAVSEERRAAFQPVYTMSGHRLPSTWASDYMAFVVPDSIIDVDDDERDIHGKLWIESVTYSRKPQTEMRIELMSPLDLNYFADVATDS